MAMPARRVLTWLQTLQPDDTVYIEDGCLRSQPTGSRLEVGEEDVEDGHVDEAIALVTGEPVPVYRNHFHCPACKYGWIHESNTSTSERCPVCGKLTTPWHSIQT